jgi:large subunit ribosomal protein L11
MAKELVAKIKLQCPGGQATPAPPVGPALGAHGIQPGDFVKKFNDATKDQQGTIIPVVVSVYKDRTYDFVLKTPPAASLLKKAANIAKGSGVPNKEKVGTVTMEQVREIAQLKMKDLNAANLDAAIKVIAGTARSMGIEVSESGKPATPPAPPAAPGAN